MSNIRQMPGAPLPEGSVIPQTVALLEELLEKARTGEVKSVAMAYIDGAGDVSTRWAHNKEWWALQGAVAQLLHRMCE